MNDTRLPETYKINAAHKVLGRLAAHIAMLLQGKTFPTFNHMWPGTMKISVFNTDKIKVTGKKLTQKLYRMHSQFHGGLKEEKLNDLLTRDSRLVLRHAVMGMLPKNKLSRIVIKNITFIRGEKSS